MNTGEIARLANGLIKWVHACHDRVHSFERIRLVSSAPIAAMCTSRSLHPHLPL